MKPRNLLFAALCSVGLLIPLSNAHAEWTLRISSNNKHPPTLVNDATIIAHPPLAAVTSQPPLAVVAPPPQPMVVMPPPSVVVAQPRPYYQVVVYENSYYQHRPDGWYRSYHPHGRWVRMNNQQPRFATLPHAPAPRFAPPPHRRYDNRRGVELRVRY